MQGRGRAGEELEADVRTNTAVGNNRKRLELINGRIKNWQIHTKTSIRTRTTKWDRMNEHREMKITNRSCQPKKC